MTLWGRLVKSRLHFYRRDRYQSTGWATASCIPHLGMSLMSAEIIGRQRPRSVMPITEAAAGLSPLSIFWCMFTYMLRHGSDGSFGLSHVNNSVKKTGRHGGCPLAQWTGG